VAALSLRLRRPSRRRQLPTLRPGAVRRDMRRRRRVEPAVERLRRRDARERQLVEPGHRGVAALPRAVRPGVPEGLPRVAGPAAEQRLAEDRVEQPRAEGLAAPSMGAHAPVAQSMAARVLARELELLGQACRETLTAATSFTARLVTRLTSIGAVEFATCMPEA
jgi:hypothetical protein